MQGGSSKPRNQHRDNFSLFSDDLAASNHETPNARAPGSRPSSSGSHSRNRILHGRPSSAQSARSSVRAQSPGARRRPPQDATVTAGSLGAADLLLPHPPRPQRGRSRGASQSPTRATENQDHYLQREDIIDECRQLKKQQRALESEIVRLKYENQRLEVETMKQRRQIEKLLNSSHFGPAGNGVPKSTGGPTALEIRRDIEKTAVVRQLKLQMNELRELLHSKDRFLESLQKSQKATHVSELEAEKEEYFAEIQRLQSRLEAKENELVRMRNRMGGSHSGGSEDDLRSEIVRLQAAYSDLLGRLSKAEQSNAILMSQISEQGSRSAVPNEPAVGNRSRPSSATSRRAYVQDERIDVDDLVSKPSFEKKRDSENVDFSSKSSRVVNCDSADRTEALPYATMANEQSHEHPPIAASKAHSAGLHHNLPDDPNGFHSSASVKVGDRIIVTSGPLSCLANVSAHTGLVTLVDVKNGYCNFKSDFDGSEYTKISIHYIRLIEVNDAPTKDSAISNLVSAQATEQVQVSSDAHVFRTCDKVEYFDGRTNKWSAGVVLKRLSNDTYDLMMDKGGEIISGVGTSAMRVRSTPSSRPSSGRSRKQDLFALGSKIEAQYRNSEKWYSGVVREHLMNGTYSIHFDDGEIVENVPLDHVRARTSSVSAEVETKTKPVENVETYLVGDKVDVNYKGNGIWYSGVITHANPDGSYDIGYDDGATEVMVRSNQMKRRTVSERHHTTSAQNRTFSPLSPPTATPNFESFDQSGPSSVFPVGTLVEARYKGRQWIPAKIVSETSHTLCNVVFLDGNKCTVPEEKLFQVSDSVPIELHNNVMVKIEEGEFLATLVDKVVLYNYSVEYLSNGERETNVTMNKIRVLSPSTAALTTPAIPETLRPSSESVSDKESSLLPKSHYFPTGTEVSVYDSLTGEYVRAVVDRHLDNGYYDVIYSDGKRMKNVSPDSIVMLDSTTDHQSNAAQAPSRPQANAVKDDTATSAADSAQKRTKSQKSSGKAEKVLTKGMRVEVKYRGGDEWMPATIVRENPDGSVDVDYDEGEREKKVHKENVRVVDEFDDYLAGLSDDDEGDDNMLANIGITEQGGAPTALPAAPQTIDDDEDAGELGLDYGVTGDGGAVYGDENAGYDEDFD